MGLIENGKCRNSPVNMSVSHADGHAVIHRRCDVHRLRTAPLQDYIDRIDVGQRRRVGAVGRAPGHTGCCTGWKRHDLCRYCSRPPPSSYELLLLRVAGRTARAHVDHGHVTGCPRTTDWYVRRDLIGQLDLDNEDQNWA